ncbi:unnamed protein product, partial [Owenia fusiformis]
MITLKYIATCTYLVVILGTVISLAFARYEYPDQPSIDFTMEVLNAKCKVGCSVCSNLRYICRGLNVTTIPQTFPKTLQYLELGTTKKGPLHIQDGAFRRYQNLIYLDISENHITKITNHSFDGLDQLAYLKKSPAKWVQYLDFIEKSTLFTNFAFHGLTPLKRLKYLDFRGNGRVGLDRMVHRLYTWKRHCSNCTLDYLDLSFTNNVDSNNHEIRSY